MPRFRNAHLGLILLGAACVWTLDGCRTIPQYAAVTPVPDDEIVISGKRLHTGTRVITWLDPHGYNAYAGLPSFTPRAASLADLQEKIDQFVLHYDACGLSSICFDALRSRELSVHFLLDIDGTIYQTLDLQERALHATTSNDRSIGIEIANIGAYPPDAAQPLDHWYRRDTTGGTSLTIPAQIGASNVLTPHFAGRPANPALIRGTINGHALVQYDFTREQYAALVKLTAALCRIFPRLRCDYPHMLLSDAAIGHRLSEQKLLRYRGILGHYHVQQNKIDPGPAFDWPRFIHEVRRELK